MSIQVYTKKFPRKVLFHSYFTKLYTELFQISPRPQYIPMVQRLNKTYPTIIYSLNQLTIYILKLTVLLALYYLNHYELYTNHYSKHTTNNTSTHSTLYTASTSTNIKPLTNTLKSALHFSCIYA